jgi:hypothetical protein
MNKNNEIMNKNNEIMNKNNEIMNTENERLEKLRQFERREVEEALWNTIDICYEGTFDYTCYDGSLDYQDVVFKYSELNNYINQFTSDSVSIVTEFNGYKKFIDDGSTFIARDMVSRYRSLLLTTIEFEPAETRSILCYIMSVIEGEQTIVYPDIKAVYYYKNDGLIFGCVNENDDEPNAYYYKNDGLIFGCVCENHDVPIDPNVNILVIGYSSEHINDNMYKDLKNLTHVVVASRITSIGDDAFSGCSNLTSAVIPHSCLVNESSFNGCPNLILRRVIMKPRLGC